MTFEQILALATGPGGLTAFTLFVIFQFASGRWIPRERLDEKDRDRIEMGKLLDKGLDNYEQVMILIKERNQADRERLLAARQAAKESQPRPNATAEVREMERRMERRTP